MTNSLGQKVLLYKAEAFLLHFNLQTAEYFPVGETHWGVFKRFRGTLKEENGAKKANLVKSGKRKHSGSLSPAHPVNTTIHLWLWYKRTWLILQISRKFHYIQK